MIESEYGKRLRAKSVGYLSGGLTKPKVELGHDAEGNRTKATTDELGNTIVEHNNKKDQVDVHIKAPQVRVKTSQEEVR